MLKTGLYVSKNDEGIFDAYTIKMKVRETEKSYIFELVSFDSQYSGVHMETFFKESKRAVLRKNKGGHAIRVWGDDNFTFYPYQAGTPYFFKIAE